VRYHPCGREVDFGRRGYTTACRFLRDHPELIGKIRWSEVPYSAPALGFPAAIEMLEWEETKEWIQDDIGEIRDADRVFNPKPAVGVNGAHVCGTERDFQEGGEYLPDLPPTVYGGSGFAACCKPLPRVSGGGGAAGKATVTFGSGATCPTAQIAALGVDMVADVVPGGPDHWFKIPVWPPGGWTFTQTVTGGALGGGSTFVFTGSSCLALNFRLGVFLVDASGSEPGVPGPSAWVQIQPAPTPGRVTVRITQP
jgi:hypothetical protein